MSKKLKLCIIIIFILSSANIGNAIAFTQNDRDRLIRVETKLDMFIKQVDERFEAVDKRFEQVDKRFEQIDKRFEQVNKRFEQMFTFLWIITGIFVTIMVANMGFAYWDRRTIIRKAKEETIEKLEREGKLHDLIESLKEYAKRNEKLAAILHDFHIL